MYAKLLGLTRPKAQTAHPPKGGDTSTPFGGVGEILTLIAGRARRATHAVIRQNLAISLGVIALLIITSVTGFVSLGIAILFHEGSTLAVVGNALRLLGYQSKSGI